MGLRQLGRSVTAGVLCLSLLGVTAMAAETKVAPDNTIAVENKNKKTEDAEKESKVRKITYEEAVKMVINNDVTMENLASQITYLQDNKEDMFVSNGGGNQPTTPDDLNVLDGNRLTFLSTVHSMTNSIEISKLSKEVTEISAGAVVKNYFSKIQQDESALKLAKENLNVQMQLYNQGTLKSDLGYLSSMDYIQLQRDLETARRNVELLELSIANTYTELNKLLGWKSSEKYELVNDVEFLPVKLSTDIDEYANRMVAGDISLRIQAIGVDSAKFAAKNIADSSTVADYRKREYDYESASRAYEEAQKQKNVNIHSAYIQLQQLEKNRENLILILKSAENTLEKAKVNYEVGNITQLAYDQAQLAVTKAQDDLQTNLLNHDLLKYSFENPCILGSVGGNGQKQ